MRIVSLLFPEPNDEGVDYIRMSKELNLHYGSLKFLTFKQGNLDEVKEIMKSSALDAKRANLFVNQGELRDKIREH